MTHIYEDIRIDAIKFMELWLNIAPDIIVDGFWQRVNCYKFFTNIIMITSNKLRCLIYKVVLNYIGLLTTDSNLPNTTITSSGD
jgi:hypothetical protein